MKVGVSGPKLSARLRILHLLKRSSGGLSAREIARELGVTSVAVRKQLAALETEGLLVQRQRPGGRGRPATVYAVSDAGEALFPQGYHQLVVDLLQDLSGLDGSEHLDRLFRLRNERLARTYQIRLADKPFAEAVQELARARDDDGYMASVEDTEGGLVLSEHNCPIYDVALRFPNACQCEQELFERVLNVTVTREKSLVEGAPACRYRIVDANS
jgi:predicted ArsR family transcriptional regulator